MLYIASALFIPLVIATPASLSLRSIVAKLCKLGLPQSFASGLLIFAIFGVVAIMAGALYVPAQQWIAAATRTSNTIFHAVLMAVAFWAVTAVEG